LIQKIYEVDPLTCAKCQGKMRIIAFIEDEEVIKKILKHLGLWESKQRPPPGRPSPPNTASTVLYLNSPVPTRLPALSYFIHMVLGGKDPNLVAGISNWMAMRAGKWLAEGHDFSVIDPVYSETFAT